MDGSGVSYSDGQKIKDLSLIDGQAITLYATWEKEKLTGITINPTAVKLAAGESAQIDVAPQPSNALLETPTFRSNNEKIATVDSTGKISAVAKGTAKITVKVSNYTRTCTVTVKDVVKIPQASIAGGEVAKNTQIILTSETAGAVIYYTLDGTDPTKAINESMTVKARWSEAEKLSAPEANYPAGKILPVDAEVILTAKKGTNIYYTLDGSTPTKESHLYQGPIVLAEDLWKDGAITIKALAAGTGYQNSEAAVYQYQLTEEPAGYGEIEVRDIPQGEIPEGMWIAGLEESYTYTGKAIKPEIHVYDHKRKLALNQDYSISYKNNTNTGKGIYRKYKEDV